MFLIKTFILGSINPQDVAVCLAVGQFGWGQRVRRVMSGWTLWELCRRWPVKEVCGTAGQAGLVKHPDPAMPVGTVSLGRVSVFLMLHWFLNRFVLLDFVQSFKFVSSFYTFLISKIASSIFPLRQQRFSTKNKNDHFNLLLNKGKS